MCAPVSIHNSTGGDDAGHKIEFNIEILYLTCSGNNVYALHIIHTYIVDALNIFLLFFHCSIQLLPRRVSLFSFGNDENRYFSIFRKHVGINYEHNIMNLLDI